MTQRTSLALPVLAPIALLAVVLVALALSRTSGSEPKRYVCPPCGLPCDTTVYHEPGTCPKCGMALEPDLSTLSSIDAVPNPELADMTRRFIVASVVGAPVFLVTMAQMLGGGPTQGTALNWMGLALALRGEQISDFPLCNKSFNLSYCGHDL